MDSVPLFVDGSAGCYSCKIGTQNEDHIYLMSTILREDRAREIAQTLGLDVILKGFDPITIDLYI